MPAAFQQILTSVGIQILASVGIFFVFGFLLSNIQRITQNHYLRVVGWKGILWTAWIGTPAHELSHVVFAWIFLHRIDHISLFAPNEETGGLGSVAHSYEKWSLYQRIGNFFIGAAPMLIGPILLTALLYALIPNPQEIFLPFTNAELTMTSLFTEFWSSITALFTPDNLRDWKFFLFLYLSFCIVSHLAPSPADLKNMMSGFIWVVLLLILGNGLAYLLDINLTAYLEGTYRYLHIFTSLFLYATLLSFIHLMFASTIFSLIRR